MYRDDEEDTVRFQAVTPPAALSTVPVSRQSLSGRELHVAELLRREGRPADEERGGMKISKLVAIASGGVVLCGTVAFGASQWLSSPDERPLADVRFDDRPAARNSNNTGGIGALALPGQLPGTSTAETGTTQQQTQEQAPQQQEQPRSVPTQSTQAPVAQAPVAQTPDAQTTQPAAPTSESTSERPTPDKGTPTTPDPTTTTPPTSSTSPSASTPSTGSSKPPSSSTPPSSSAPSSSAPTSSAPSTGIGLGLSVGGFDFFAEL